MNQVSIGQALGTVKGKGAWHLMYARGGDGEAARLGRAAQRRLVTPWLPRVRELTGLSRGRLAVLLDVCVAAGGAAIDGWLEGALARKEAAAVATRALSALLAAFAEGGSHPRAAPRG